MATSHDGALSPARAFAVALGLVALSAAAGVAARPPADRPDRAWPAARADAPAERARGAVDEGAGAPEEVSNGPAPQHTPSPDAAERVFRTLRRRLDRALDRGDVAAVRALATAEGSVRTRSLQVLRFLRRNHLRDLTRERTVTVVPARRSETSLRLRERVVLQPCLQTRGGRDVTDARAEIGQVIRWRVVRRAGRWMLQRATLLRDRVLDRRRAQC